MIIATYNINNVNRRLPNLIEWLGERKPDVACLQELKADQNSFPVKELARAGYRAVWQGQRTWNGVAILASPYAFIYDFVMLAVPLAFLGRAGFSGKELIVVVAAALLVGWGPADHLATGLVAGMLVLGLVVGRVCTESADHLGGGVERAKLQP